MTTVSLDNFFTSPKVNQLCHFSRGNYWYFCGGGGGVTSAPSLRTLEILPLLVGEADACVSSWWHYGTEGEHNTKIKEECSVHPRNPTTASSPSNPRECGIQPSQQRHLFQLAVKEHGFPPVVPCTAAAPMLPPCECSRGAAWQHAPVAWRLRCPSPHLPSRLSVRLPSLPVGLGASDHTTPNVYSTPFPTCAHAHRTTASPAHQRSGEVRSALEPGSQVVQPCGRAGKDALTGGCWESVAVSHPTFCWPLPH